MQRVDFHTHSQASPDGGIQTKQYHALLDSGKLHVIAITDHNEIKFAQELQKELGDKIIVGEEIMTPEGEIVGLFLKKLVKPDQTPLQTVKAIKEQGGIVYIPHPFETLRHGLSKEVLDEITDYVDIVEVYNGRAVLQNRSADALAWAREARKAIAASSDAHGLKGVGHTYTRLEQSINQQNAVASLANARLINHRAPLRSLAYPKFHRLHKKIRRTK